jgi:hypothetical protein
MLAVACSLYGCKPNSPHHVAWVGKFDKDKLFLRGPLGMVTPAGDLLFFHYFYSFLLAMQHDTGCWAW